MTVIHHIDDADRSCIAGSRIAVVGYGDAGSAWARNLRDAGHEVIVCTRSGPSAERAAIDGFAHRPLVAAADADIICLLVPDGVISTLGLDPAGWALTVVASGAVLASGRFDPNGDVGMLVPKAHPRDVRDRFVSGEGVAAAIGVHHDRTGCARRRLIALADAIGALGGGAIEMAPSQEALLHLAVEHALRPELEAVCSIFLQSMLAHGVPLDAVINELVVGNELEGVARVLRSPTGLDDGVTGDRDLAGLRMGAALRRVVDDLAAGRLSDELCCDGNARLDALLRSHDLDRTTLAHDLRARMSA